MKSYLPPAKTDHEWRVVVARWEADNDTEAAMASLAKPLAKIRQWQEAAQQAVDAS